jgi:23S rRNA A2030 N6-methylase RlmJ
MLREKKIFEVMKLKGISFQEANKLVSPAKSWRQTGGLYGNYGNWREKQIDKAYLQEYGVERPKENKEKNKPKKNDFQLDKSRPPPEFTGQRPGSGAWGEGRPETEDQRQGLYKSPWTGQVYDRWAPIGLKQRSTDRQGGLGRSRAFQTPTQMNLNIVGDENKVMQEADYYDPDLVPAHLRPPERKPKPIYRCAQKAGCFPDILKQIVVQTIVDLKVQKAQSPVWYVEPCAGEGEYHVSRLGHKRMAESGVRRPLDWPTTEVLYETLNNLDEDQMMRMPKEVQGWMNVVRSLNEENPDFEVKGEAADARPEDGIQWLPSSLHCALQYLRPQDPVTLFEDNPASFASMFNFIRNFSERFAPHIELLFLDGFKSVEERFFKVNKRHVSEAHGSVRDEKGNKKRGVIFIDSDWNRGGEKTYWNERLVTEHKVHWNAATVVMTYPITPNQEVKVRNLNRRVRQSSKTLDLLTVEMYVNNPLWSPNLTEEEQIRVPRWRGCGCLISNPPYTTAERIRSAMGAICKELSKRDDALEMRVSVEKLVYEERTTSKGKRKKSFA